MHPTGAMNKMRAPCGALGLGGIKECAKRAKLCACCPKAIPLTESIGEGIADAWKQALLGCLSVNRSSRSLAQLLADQIVKI